MGKEGENSRVSLAAAPQPKYNDDGAKNRISCCQWFFARFRGLANLFHSWPSPRITFTLWQRASFVAIYTQICNVMYRLFSFFGATTTNRYLSPNRYPISIVCTGCVESYKSFLIVQQQPLLHSVYSQKINFSPVFRPLHLW